MKSFKLLIDTNVVIELEDNHQVDSSFADLVRISQENSVSLFVHSYTSTKDIGRDKNQARRSVTLSKIAKFPRLGPLPRPDIGDLVRRYGAIKDDNDLSDVNLLLALDARAADLLVTEDIGLRKRAERHRMGDKVLSVDEALMWLRQSFEKNPIDLPYVEDRLAYQIDVTDEIFIDLRADYPGFDKWFDKCRNEHRECWILEISNKIAGLIVRKDEEHFDARTKHPGPKILKICTFKIKDEFRGEKFGELLLKQVLWFAQHNAYDVIYLTVFPKHVRLIDLLSFYGFEITQRLENEELVMEKTIANGPLPKVTNDILVADRKYYPRYLDDDRVRKFCVPIQANYHRRLFPEISISHELPLFPKDTFGPMLGADPRQGRMSYSPIVGQISS